ncbi:MAG TPA: c-type cytochrome [Candidatus Deferrimicrobium sp.]|nr:c-type cytochrome [Candidatus Deferrimicrobium sp.]
MNQFFTPPALKFLHVIPSLIYLMLLFHLPYMGLVLGSTMLSTVYHKWKPGPSRELLNLVTTKMLPWLVFGLLPVVTLVFLYKLLLFNTPIPIHLYLLGILGIQGLGFIMLFIYRRTGYFMVRLAAVLLLGLYCFYFIDITSLMVFPEKWFFLKRPLPYPLFSITPLLDFLEFLCLSLIITGAAILFFYFQFYFQGPGKRLPENTPHDAFLKYNGYALILTGALLMPLIILWDLFTLTGYALSIWVFVLTGVMLTVLAFTAYAVVTIIQRKAESLKLLRQYSVVIFMVSLLLFGLWIAKDRALQTNANLETAAALSGDALKTLDEINTKREEQYAKSIVGDEKLGEQIYNDKCSACHSFDRKVLGPPFNNVLTKYLDNQAELEAFLKNPKKIDPQYPAMPNPGLSPIQNKAVVKFLMVKMGVKDENKEADINQDKDENKDK